MTTLIAVFASILAILVVYLFLAPAALGVVPFLRRRRLACPKYGVYTDVKLNGLVAALTTAYGHPRFRVSHCHLLAPGDRCDEACLKAVSEDPVDGQSRT